MSSGKMLWNYRAVFKQTNAGGGIVNVIVTAQERTEILYGLIGPNDYAADRTIGASIQDADLDNIGRALKDVATDNEEVAFPVANSAVEEENEFEKRIVLGKLDRLVINAATLVQNEELTVAIRALIKTTKPVVITTGSTGTVTTTVSFNRVI